MEYLWEVNCARRKIQRISRVLHQLSLGEQLQDCEASERYRNVRMGAAYEQAQLNSS